MRLLSHLLRKRCCYNNISSCRGKAFGSPCVGTQIFPPSRAAECCTRNSGDCGGWPYVVAASVSAAGGLQESNLHPNSARRSAVSLLSAAAATTTTSKTERQGKRTAPSQHFPRSVSLARLPCAVTAIVGRGNAPAAAFSCDTINVSAFRACTPRVACVRRLYAAEFLVGETSISNATAEGGCAAATNSAGTAGATLIIAGEARREGYGGAGEQPVYEKQKESLNLDIAGGALLLTLAVCSNTNSSDRNKRSTSRACCSSGKKSDRNTCNTGRISGACECTGQLRRRGGSRALPLRSDNAGKSEALAGRAKKTTHRFPPAQCCSCDVSAGNSTHTQFTSSDLTSPHRPCRLAATLLGSSQISGNANAAASASAAAAAIHSASSALDGACSSGALSSDCSTAASVSPALSSASAIVARGKEEPDEGKGGHEDVTSPEACLFVPCAASVASAACASNPPLCTTLATPWHLALSASDAFPTALSADGPARSSVRPAVATSHSGSPLTLAGETIDAVVIGATAADAAAAGVVDAADADAAWPPVSPSAAASSSQGLYQELSADSPLQLFSGAAHPELAREIAAHLNVSLGRVQLGRFLDGECLIRVLDEVRGRDVFVIQSAPAAGGDLHSSLVELFLLITTMRRASAKRVTAVMPYFPYGRETGSKGQRDDICTPMAAADLAVLLQVCGADAVIFVDVHNPRIEGFFTLAGQPPIPMSNIDPHGLAAQYLQKKDLIKPVVVATDNTAGENASSMWTVMKQYGIKAGFTSMVCDAPKRQVREGAPIHPPSFAAASGAGAGAPPSRGAAAGSGVSALGGGGDSTRRQPRQEHRLLLSHLLDANELKNQNLVGAVEGCDCVIVDDIIDTGEKAEGTANDLKAGGARRIFMFASHGILSKGAVDRINNSPIEEICSCVATCEASSMHGITASGKRGEQREKEREIILHKGRINFDNSDVVVTNTVPIPAHIYCEKLVVLSVGKLLAEAIKRVHEDQSVSVLCSSERNPRSA